MSNVSNNYTEQLIACCVYAMLIKFTTLIILYLYVKWSLIVFANRERERGKEREREK